MNLKDRRGFLQSFSPKVKSNKGIPVNVEDPLFAKYAKKKAGRIIAKDARKTPSAKGLTEYTGPWTALEANHLLRRLQYGVKYTELQAALTKTMSQVVDDLFTFSSTVSSPTAQPLNHYQTAADATNPLVDPVIGLGMPWPENHFTDGTTLNNNLGGNRRLSLARWLWGVMLNESNTARNKVTDFWMHFIPTDAFNNTTGTNFATFSHDYHKLMRENCIGNFKTLIDKVTKAPKMLDYLSNHFSTAAQPNENYARELLELFTIGKDPVNQSNNKYTEDDIKAAAKVLSGWKIANIYSTTYPITGSFVSGNHNQTNKVFSSNFGNTTIANQTGANGANELQQFYDMLFNFQGVKISEYIAERMYRYFVYYEIDQNTKDNVIVPLGKLLRDSNWEVLPVFKKLLKSEHFFDIINRGVMIKSPFDFMTSMIQNFNVGTTVVDGNNATNVKNQYNLWNYLNSQTISYEQGMCSYPTVSGYKAYYQQPVFYQSWINSNTVQKREGSINNFITGTVQGGIRLQFDFVKFIKQFPLDVQRDPNLLINESIKFLFPHDISITFKAVDLKKTSLLNNQDSDYYWTDAWNAHLATPTSSTALKTVTDRLKAMFTTLIKSAEYQLI